MNITSEQRKVLTFIMENREILEELLKNTSSQKQVKDLHMKESIVVAGIHWSKFAEDEEGNAYMLADESIGDMEFGKNNDWRESQIREKLNNDLYQKIVDELGTDAIVSIQTDLFSHDGLRDYGKCDDLVSLLTYDLYRNNRKEIKKSSEWWLLTPYSTLSSYSACFVLCVVSNGDVCFSDCGYGKGVRPFFILKSDIFVSCDIAEGSQ